MVDATLPTSAARTSGLPVDPRSAPVPSPILPGEHFAAALVFFVVGALGLREVATDLAAGVAWSPSFTCSRSGGS